MALFRLRADLHLTRQGHATWAREAAKVRADLAKPVNDGKPHAEPVLLDLRGDHLRVDLPFPERLWAEATWDTLLGLAARGYVQAGTRSQFSSMDLHVCNNEDPPQPCLYVLAQWDNAPTPPPLWESGRVYGVGAEVQSVDQWWRSTAGDNEDEPGMSGTWVVI